LTVEKGRPGSHQNKGWEKFTDCVIQKLSENKKNLVFLLWGRFAQGKERLIDSYKHGILKAAHPSPFSAHMGFFGCKHFSKTNEFLKQHNLPTINW
ncbi:MAG: uracil-DNA glycosylase family protein, partial [Bacteroidota bacterium]|nr:uracil-DNA glycosylase family protein [Bacteroidota bacterium]